MAGNISAFLFGHAEANFLTPGGDPTASRALSGAEYELNLGGDFYVNVIFGTF